MDVLSAFYSVFNFDKRQTNRLIHNCGYIFQIRFQMDLLHSTFCRACHQGNIAELAYAVFLLMKRSLATNSSIFGS